MNVKSETSHTLLVKPNLVFWPGALYLIEEKKNTSSRKRKLGLTTGVARLVRSVLLFFSFLGKKFENFESRSESENAQLIVFVCVFMILSVVFLNKF